MSRSIPEDASILLIEDDTCLAEMVTDALGARGYRVWHARTGAEAEALLDEIRADLILLDLMLPDRNGLLLCIKLMEAHAGIPLIVCSATKRKDDAVLALKVGADDFLAKPFSIDELQLRIELALLHSDRSQGADVAGSNQVQQIGDMVIEHTQRRVTIGGRELHLTPTEYRLLCAVADRPREVVARGELAESVWGSSDDGILRSLDVHMRRLRGKLKSGCSPAPVLVTRRGFGYQLLDEVRR
jgi:DNA-binding response OmpR family regulator